MRAGWREWVSLPDLGIAVLPAKLDSGARTSALHAVVAERYTDGGAPWVRLLMDRRGPHACSAPVVDERWVRNSGGQAELRLVIATTVVLGGEAWCAEFTVTNRARMRHRALLGRTALAGRWLVDPAETFLQGGRPGAGRATRR